MLTYLAGNDGTAHSDDRRMSGRESTSMIKAHHHLLVGSCSARDRIRRTLGLKQTIQWWHCVAIVILAATSAEIPRVAAQTDTLPRLYSNEAYAEDAMRATVLEISNPMAV